LQAIFGIKILMKGWEPQRYEYIATTMQPYDISLNMYIYLNPRFVCYNRKNSMVMSVKAYTAITSTTTGY